MYQESVSQIAEKIWPKSVHAGVAQKPGFRQMRFLRSFAMVIIVFSAAPEFAFSQLACLEGTPAQAGGTSLCVTEFAIALCNVNSHTCPDRTRALCEAKGGEWYGPNGCNGIVTCTGAHKVTEANVAEVAERYFKIIKGVGECPSSGDDTGWNYTIADELPCWAIGPTYENGVEIRNARVFSFSGERQSTQGCGPAVSHTTMVRRDRKTVCPIGYGLIAENNETICAKKNDQTCPVGNPAQPGSGNKVLRQIDIAPTAASPLRFERTYNSFPYTQPRTVAGSLPAPLGTNWRGSYDQRIIPVANSLSVGAIAMREDGGVKYFDIAGQELQHDKGARETLTALSPDGWRYNRSDDAVEIYNADGRLISIADRDGRITTITYDVDDRIAQVEDHAGRSLTFSYRLGFLEAIADSAGGIVHYTFDENANLREVGYPDTANPRMYEYQGTLLTKIADENGDWHAGYAYDSSSRVKTSALAPGLAGGTIAKHTFTYAATTTTVLMPTGASTVYGITTTGDGVLRVGSMSQPCAQCGGTSSATTYDAGGYRDLVTDFNGTVTDYDFNSRGLETQRIEAKQQGGVTTLPEKRTVQTDWHATFRQPTERRTYSAGNVLVAKSSWTHNARGQVSTQTTIDPSTLATRTTAYTYCESTDVALPNSTCPLLGLLKSIDGPRTDASDLTTYIYYPSTDESGCASVSSGPCHRKGDLWTVTNALGQVTETLRYDRAGRVRASKDPNGVVTEFAWHPRGWLTARIVRGATLSENVVTSYAYDAVGQVTRITQPDEDFLDYEYDAAHRLVAIEDAVGNRIDYTLDAAGNRTAETTSDAAAVVKRQLTRVYDQLGRLDQQLDAQSRITGFAYDANGNQTNIEDALNVETKQDYDPLNRLKKTIQDYTGLDVETNYTYDALDRLVTVTDPKGLDTDYTYDGLGNLTELDSPDTGVTTYTYDAAGNRLTQTDARGITATHTYDALSRLTGTTYPTSSLNVTYYYDLPGSTKNCSNRVGRLAESVDASGVTSYCYDRRGNLTHKSWQASGKTLATTYLYTKGDRLQSTILPTGLILAYTRNSLGQLTAATRTDSTPDEAIVTSADYLPFGPLQDLTFAGGATQTFDHDQNYWTDGVSGTALSLDFTLDATGNIVAANDPASASARLYTYDPLARLTDIDTGSNTLIEAFTYDGTGNRLSKQTSGGTQTYGYPPSSHRLTSIDAQPRVYDAMGSLTTRGTDTFTYDDRQRLSAYGASVTYKYNARGERASKTVAGVTTHYVYDEAGHLIAELDPATTPPAALRSYIWLEDRPVALYAHTGAYANQWLHIHTDHLGTPRAITRPAASNTTIWRWDFNGSAFGDHAPQTDPDGDATHFSFNLRFPGQYFDTESALHYNYFRDYEAGTGRYVESDPIGLEGGRSTYGYVGQNPLPRVDPSGLKVEMRCRSVGAPFNPGFRSGVAAFLGGEHCYLVVSCPMAGFLSSHISYPGFISHSGSPPNNDRLYSSEGRYRNLPVAPPRENQNDCLDCDFERCIYNYANILAFTGYTMTNYSIWGPNSNSFARRLVEVCGGGVGGSGPPTGWDDAGSVGF